MMGKNKGNIFLFLPNFPAAHYSILPVFLYSIIPTFQFFTRCSLCLGGEKKESIRE